MDTFHEIWTVSRFKTSHYLKYSAAVYRMKKYIFCLNTDMYGRKSGHEFKVLLDSSCCLCLIQNAISRNYFFLSWSRTKSADKEWWWETELGLNLSRANVIEIFRQIACRQIHNGPSWNRFGTFFFNSGKKRNEFLLKFIRPAHFVFFVIYFPMMEKLAISYLFFLHFSSVCCFHQSQQCTRSETETVWIIHPCPSRLRLLNGASD